MDNSHAPVGDGEKHTPTTDKEHSADTYAKHVADYFGAYVSGALTFEGLPLRIFDSTYHNGVLRTLPLDKFPQLQKNMYKNIINGLSQQTFVITQNKYTTRQDDHLLYLFGENIESISESELSTLLHTISSHAEAKLIDIRNEAAVDKTQALLSFTKKALNDDFVVPFMLPLKDIDVIAQPKLMNEISYLQEASVSRIFDASKELLRQIYLAYFSTDTYIQKDSLIIALTEIFSPKLLKDSLETLLDEIRSDDAYHYAYALHRSVTSSTNKSLFVYFCELSYNNNKFPLFYTRVKSNHSLPSVTLTFENQMYVNRPAINYVLRHFAATTGITIDISALDIPSVIELSDETDEMQRIVSRILHLLNLVAPVNLSDASIQLSSNPYVSLTNKTYFYVDSVSSTGISENYKFIQNDVKLSQKTQRYIESLLLKEPVRIIDEINEKWDAKTNIEKLIPTIPLPVNDEQNKILMALRKSGSDRIVVDSPDSTGKNHTIQAAVFDSLSRGESVVVAGNNSQFSRRLRESIANQLSEMTGTKGHIPVLDIHTSADISDSIDEQLIAKVNANAHVVEGKLSDLAVAKKRKKQALKESYATYVQNAENINLHEIERSITNDKLFAGKDWIRDEPLNDISAELLQLHRAIQYVNSSTASYLMPYVDPAQHKGISDFINAYKHYEKASRDISSQQPQFIIRYKKLLPDQKQHVQESLAYIQSNYKQFVRILNNNSASNWLHIEPSDSFQTIKSKTALYNRVASIAQNAAAYFSKNDKTTLLHELETYSAHPNEIIDALDTYIEQIATLKSKLFGFSGRTLVVENLNKQLLKSLPVFSLPEPEKQTDNMQIMSDFVKYALEELSTENLSAEHWVNIVHIMLTEKSQLKEVHQLLDSLNQVADYDFIHPYRLDEADNLIANISLLEYATNLNTSYRNFPKIAKIFGISGLNHLLARPHEFQGRVTKLSRDINEATQLDEAKNIIKNFIDLYPRVAKRLGINLTQTSLEVGDPSFANATPDTIKEYVAYKKKEQDLRDYLQNITLDSFIYDSTEFQQILGIEVQHTQNKNLLQITNEKSNFISSVVKNLQDQQSISTDNAAKLRKLFPCIAGDVASLCSILPLEHNVFDLAIIDNADSLTISEVLPIALRARKLLILGDSKKSIINRALITVSANNYYKGMLTEILKDRLSGETADNKNRIIPQQDKLMVANLSSFNFYLPLAHYSITLKKQFGTYEELAAFGNKYFYNNSLISLTSKAIEKTDLYSITHVKAARNDVTRFTNKAEAREIISLLHKMKDEGFSGSIGIVTPFAEQASLLQKEIDECVITDWFEDRQLQVMTFNDKRIIPRDLMIYSLVASDSFNELSQQLPQSVHTPESEGDNRSARLLSAFSGSHHAIHIVHSLPFDEYGGALSEALPFIEGLFATTPETVKRSTNDILVQTESNIQKTFENTSFARKHTNHATFMAKYPFFDYIKQLSPKYRKAAYKLHFLIMTDTNPIVIEYDDFKDRFLQNSKDPNGSYLSAEDIYGYKLLEGYGYRFLRLNKYTIGSEPVKTLDTYLNELTKRPSWPSDNGYIA